MPKAELYQRVTGHEAETVAECLTAIQMWREAVVAFNAGEASLDYERECYRYKESFPSNVYSEAESYLRRSVQ